MITRKIARASKGLAEVGCLQDLAGLMKSRSCPNKTDSCFPGQSEMKVFMFLGWQVWIKKGKEGQAKLSMGAARIASRGHLMRVEVRQLWSKRRSRARSLGRAANEMQQNPFAANTQGS